RERRSNSRVISALSSTTSLNASAISPETPARFSGSRTAKLPRRKARKADRRRRASSCVSLTNVSGILPLLLLRRSAPLSRCSWAVHLQALRDCLPRGAGSAQDALEFRGHVGLGQETGGPRRERAILELGVQRSGHDDRRQREIAAQPDREIDAVHVPAQSDIDERQLRPVPRRKLDRGGGAAGDAADGVIPFLEKLREIQREDRIVFDDKDLRP